MKYGVTVGEGDLADMALVQLRSLHKYAGAEKTDIVANCPPNEWKNIPTDQRDRISALGETNKNGLTIPENPLSASHATALCALEAAENDEPIALLDTDTVVLRPIEGALAKGDDVALKPADFHPERVGLSKSTLRAAFEATNTEMPQQRLRSTVDGKEIPTYWNSGVVISDRVSFFKRWIDLTNELFEEFPEEFFLDQLSLAVTSAEFDVTKLPESYNFLLPQRLWTPSSTHVIHYHRIDELRWVTNPRIYEKLRQIGAFDELSFGSIKKQLKLPAIKLARLRLRQ